MRIGLESLILMEPILRRTKLLRSFLDYLVQDRKWKGSVARSVATTHLIDAIAKKHNLPVLVTPVGFKYLAEFFLEQKIILGCEESAGFSVQGHLPEKDGILTCRLLLKWLRQGRKLLKRNCSSCIKTYGYQGKADERVTNLRNNLENVFRIWRHILRRRFRETGCRSADALMD